MAFKITMGSAEAQELQNSIQQELAKFEYAPEDDPVMAEYITVMLANNKTSDQITEELVDLVGDNYEPSFTTWLFARASGEGSRPIKAEEVDPSAEQQVEAALDSDRAAPPHLRQQNQGAMFAKALAGASSNPSSSTSGAQKRTASMRDASPSAAAEGEPLSKRRTSGGAAGAALPTGPRSGGGKNLLDRMGGAQGNEIRNNQDAFQSKIDNLTHNSAQMGASLGMTPQQQQQQIAPSFPPRNQHQQQQQQQRGGMNMGGYGGGMGMNGMGMGGYGGGGMGMGMGVQEMMLAQMAQMQFMQQQMQQFAQQGGLLPQQQQQQQPFSGGPQRTNGGSNRPNHHNQAPRGGAGPGGRASPKPYTPTLAKPTDPTLCKFSLGCSNAQCPYSHPSPVATPETALVLSTEPCELQRKCKDPDCLKSHVSPASVAGHAGPSQLPCKYQNCNNPSCPFLHTDDQGNPIPPPALTDPSLAVPHTKKDPKFAPSAPAPTSSKPWLKNGGGGFSPYSKSKPAPAINASMVGMNKSVKFNPEAKAFVPKPTSASHISDRLVDQTEGEAGGEKIIPAPAPTPSSVSSTPAPAVAPVPEVKKEVEA